MSTQGKPLVQSEMLTFRCSAQERIELGKLANKRRQSVSDTLRALIAQATAAQKTPKSAAAVAAQTTNTAG